MRHHAPVAGPGDDLLRAARALLGASVSPVGRSGRSFVVDAAGERLVLRLYPDLPARAAVDAALLRLVGGLLPVPEVVEARTAAAPGRPAFLLRSYVAGETCEGRPGAESRQAADRVTAVLAAVPVLRAGDLVDGSLTPVPGPDDEPGPGCLVHGDLHPRHLIRDPVDGGLLAVLGWDAVRAQARHRQAPGLD